MEIVVYAVIGAVLLLSIAGTVRVAQRERRLEALSRPENPALPEGVSMAAIRRDLGGWLPRLRGKVTVVCTVSTPRFSAGEQSNDVSSCYRSFLIDSNGEAHDLEVSSSFATIDENARWLAELLEVRYDANA